MMEFVCWLWKPKPEYRSQFTFQQVNILRNMIDRNYPHSHRLTCITDDVSCGGYDSRIRLIPLWDDHGRRESIYGPGTPSCYRRLKAFSSDMREIIGPRFLSIDLDVCITGDISNIVHRKEDFVIWGASGRRTPYNGSMWMMNAGARERVWTRFNENPEKAVVRARGAGFYGSDQAWMSYALGPQEAKWAEQDGVFSYRMHVKPRGGAMPPNARIVFFEGHYDPWSPAVQQAAKWIEEHYK